MVLLHAQIGFLVLSLWNEISSKQTKQEVRIKLTGWIIWSMLVCDPCPIETVDALISAQPQLMSA